MGILSALFRRAYPSILILWQGFLKPGPLALVEPAPNLQGLVFVQTGIALEHELHAVADRVGHFLRELKEALDADTRPAPCGTESHLVGGITAISQVDGLVDD
jgi:hypothetical protein